MRRCSSEHVFCLFTNSKYAPRLFINGYHRGFVDDYSLWMNIDLRIYRSEIDADIITQREEPKTTAWLGLFFLAFS